MGLLPDDVVQLIVHYRRTAAFVLTEERKVLMEEVRMHRGFAYDFLQEEVGALWCERRTEKRELQIIMTIHPKFFAYVLEVTYETHPYGGDELTLYIEDDDGRREMMDCHLVEFQLFTECGNLCCSLYKHFHDDFVWDILERCDNFTPPIKYMLYSVEDQTFFDYPD